ncbi:MAG: MetQ/NlpA family ABC transporter substrate-binding protein [bacterium]
MVKKLWLIGLVFVLAASLLTGCGKTDNAAKEGGAQEEVVLKVGATPVPHAEILEAVKDALAKDGVKLEVVEFTDYVKPNTALADKEIQANYFQHIPYLDDFNKQRGTNLVSVAKVHIEPMGIYSQKIKDLKSIADKAVVAIPNDPSNGGRALLLLEKAGLLKLKEGVGVAATKNDIVENPKNIELKEMEAAQLPRVLQDTDVAVINTNFALDAGLNPLKDSLFIEDADSPYVNVLVVNAGDENNPEIQKLVKALTSEEVKKFINDKYQGAIVPAF